MLIINLHEFVQFHQYCSVEFSNITVSNSLTSLFDDLVFPTWNFSGDSSHEEVGDKLNVLHRLSYKCITSRSIISHVSSVFI